MTYEENGTILRLFEISTYHHGGAVGSCFYARDLPWHRAENQKAPLEVHFLVTITISMRTNRLTLDRT